MEKSSLIAKNCLCQGEAVVTSRRFRAPPSRNRGGVGRAIARAELEVLAAGGPRS